TGEPAYDDLNQKWQQQPVPTKFSSPQNWNTTGLSHGATQTYSCLELFALGINKALDAYPGGRSEGLIALANNSFDTKEMSPSFFNLQYSGPAGFMNFSTTGDLRDGHFEVSYLMDGVGVPYAKLNSSSFKRLSNDDIVYLGNTTKRPVDIASQTYLNPSLYNAAGIIIMVVCILGTFVCIIMIVLILIFRHLKPIMISSPAFCYLQLLGLIMCYLSLLLAVGKPTIATCITRQFLLPMGFVFVVGSIIAKNFRIYKIYQNVFTVRTSRLRSAYLLRIVGLFQLFVVVPLVVWDSVYSIKVVSYQISTTSFCYYCQYHYTLNGHDGRLNLAQLFIIIWIFILIIAAALLAFKTRGVSSKWSETTQIAYVSYNLGVSAIVLIPSMMLSSDNYIISLCLNIAAILFGASFTLIVLFIPKFLYICRHIHQNSKRLNIYRMNSQSQSQMCVTPMGQIDQVVEEMQDCTLKAHEGMIPVKKVAKLNFFSIWELKRVLLNTGQDASLYNYTSCEVVPSGKKDHQIFRVFTEEGVCFLFQVYDRESLDRWVDWFNVGTEQTSPEISLPPPTQAPGRMPKDDSVTFGQIPSEVLYNPYSFQATDSCLAHSLRPSVRFTSQASLDTNNPSAESHNSFGVSGSASQRYPK
ncbi:hypothetical protein CU098_002568, partial [Rhizopus stolonifer]